MASCQTGLMNLFQRIFCPRPDAAAFKNFPTTDSPSHENPVIHYMGHAAFYFSYKGTNVLLDPWFYPAFYYSWFPFPNNRWLEEWALSLKVDVLYISHMHTDHLDVKFLEKLPNKENIQVICARFASFTLAAELRKLGFSKIKLMKHKEEFLYNKHLRIQMLWDVSFKEDSAILLEALNVKDPPQPEKRNSFVFLNINDCNTKATELPDDVDLLTAQFAGAQWYPATYEYPKEEMGKHVEKVLSVLKRGLKLKMKFTNCKWFMPSAGVHCFLDPMPSGNGIWRFNDFSRRDTISPAWEHFSEGQEYPCEIRRLLPGDGLRLEKTGPGGAGSPEKWRFWSLEATPESGKWITETKENMEEYQEMRKEEWMLLHTTPFEPVTTEDMRVYFKKLHKANKFLINQCGFTKDLIIKTLTDDGKNEKAWQCMIGYRPFDGAEAESLGDGHGGVDKPSVEKGEYDIRISEVNQPLKGFREEYSFGVHEFILRKIVDGDWHWEDAMVSNRVQTRRYPDMYDEKFMGLMRYGHAPAITKGIVALQKDARSEMIEHPALPGARFQRWCPHQGGDLSNAIIVNGVITCPTHGWQFCAETGKCIKGGTTDLRFEKLMDW